MAGTSHPPRTALRLSLLRLGLTSNRNQTETPLPARLSPAPAFHGLTHEMDRWPTGIRWANGAVGGLTHQMREGWALGQAKRLATRSTRSTRSRS
jgi:hypothetical protein